jgi:hypothetical protein
MLKKITCILLSVFILSAFILQSNIYIILASDNDFTLSVSYDKARNGFALSSSESSNAVNNKGDIYTSDHLLMFMYTPADSYNWTTYAKNTVLTLHLSDSQLKAILMSSNPFENLFYMIKSLSNTETIRAIAKGLGIAFNGKSSVGTELLDTITGNYNYLNGINYDIESQTLTIDNSSVDKLREEIKKYYYNSIGLKEKKSNGTVSSIIDSSDFRSCFEYEEDYINAFGYKNYKYCLKTYYGFYYFFNDLSDYIYVSNDSNNDRFLSSYDNWTKETWRFRTLKSDGTTGFLQPVKEDTVIRYDFTLKVNVSDMYFWYTPSNSDWVLRPDWNNDYSKWVEFYSKDKTSLKFWSSYSALYNYLHGDQNAYLSSKIEETGQDISMSIKDMDANLGNKMDALIDSINSGKGNMSADELQNAIDKGLEDLNKNTEDIKDNTSDILDTLKEQNNILLQILGVTEYIAYQNDKYNNTYTKADMSNLFKKSFNRVSDAVLYGEKVDDDNENTVDRSKFSYHNGIFGHFPFSVPYQLYEWLKVFQAEPECPEFTYHYGFLIGISKDDDEYDKYKITFNLSAYESWREVAASLLKLSFTLTMAIGTYKKFKGEL